MATRILNGVLLDDHVKLSLSDLSRACARHAEWIEELVEEGILDPQGGEPATWRFSSNNLIRAHRAMRLERDLRINTAGIALALDLIEQMEGLRARLRRIEQPGY
jgi:chaperone modulatory protein CbpM